MFNIELFQAIQNSNISLFIEKQSNLFTAVVQIFHILGLIFLLSSILLVSFRVLGIGLLSESVGDLAKATSRLIWIGLALLTITGILTFLPAAAHYYPNSAFRLKMLLLAVALIFQVTLYRNFLKPNYATTSLVAKSTAVLSLFLWFAVAFSGRFIGFV